MGWGGMGWDGMGQNGTGLDRMRWDRMRWDGMGWIGEQFLYLKYFNYVNRHDFPFQQLSSLVVDSYNIAMLLFFLHKTIICNDVRSHSLRCMRVFYE